jgi:hypothetical protein
MLTCRARSATLIRAFSIEDRQQVAIHPVECGAVLLKAARRSIDPFRNHDAAPAF